MDCNRNDCLHYEVCEEWKTLGNENYINESNGKCDFYKQEKIIPCKDCKYYYPDEDGRGHHCERDSNVRFSVYADFYCSGAIRK